MAGGLGVPGGTTCIIASSLSPANFKISNISFTFFCTLNLQILIYYLIHSLNFCNRSGLSVQAAGLTPGGGAAIFPEASGFIPAKYCIALNLTSSSMLPPGVVAVSLGVAAGLGVAGAGAAGLGVAGAGAAGLDVAAVAVGLGANQ
jgi:hypothetical protein